MLTLANRDQYATLMDADTLKFTNDRPAIIYVATNQEPIIVTRSVLLQRIHQAAASLLNLGLIAEDLVIIAHTQSLESIYAFWGALAMGAIPSMFPTLTEKLDPDVYMKSMGELVRLSDAAAVLTTDEFAPLLRPKVTAPVFGSATLATSSSSPPTIAFQPDAEAIAFLQHSSGTTGLQKGVALSHAAVLNQIAAYSQAIALCEDDVVVSWLPLYHDMGLIAGFILPLMQGVPLVLMSPFDWVSHPAMLFRAIHDYAGTLCWLPNFAYNHCANRIRRRDSQGLSVATMRLFINCSEPVRDDSHQLFLERFADNGMRPEMLGVSYAMAENTFAVTQTTPHRVARVEVIDGEELELNRYAKITDIDSPSAQRRVSCGLSIAGTELRILNDNGDSLDDRYVGEVAIRSSYLLSAYYRRPDLQPFDDEGWFLTGDMGYMAGGELFIVGRAKDLIINAGKNVYPADIEAVINEVAGVRAGRAVVFGVADKQEGTELLAAVAEVLTKDETERRAIGRAIRLEVARQTSVTLSYVHLVGPKWLLKTSSGKIARGANRDKWRQEVMRASKSS